MADLDLITQQVIEKEKKSLANKVEEERQKAEEEIQNAKESAQEKQAKQSERIDQDVLNQYEIDQNSISINERNEKLKIKQTYIEKVFSEVQVKMDQVDQATFKQFTEGVLEKFSNHEKLSLVLGEKSKGLIDREWLESLNLSHLDISLSEHTVPNESGFLLEDESVEFNFLFSELIKNSKNDYIRKIDRELFS